MGHVSSQSTILSLVPGFYIFVSVQVKYGQKIKVFKGQLEISVGIYTVNVQIPHDGEGQI